MASIFFVLFSKDRKKILKQKYIRIVGNPKWAEITTDNLKKVSPDDDDNDLDLLKVIIKLFLKTIICYIIYT